MAGYGPVPNRSDDLSPSAERVRKHRAGADGADISKGTALPVRWPEADEHWHPIARMLWDAAQESGQRDYYQQTDVALMFSLCEDLSRYKSGGKRSGQMLQTIYSALGSLLVTEGDRRRLRIELEAPVEQEEDASVTAIADYKKALGQ